MDEHGVYFFDPFYYEQTEPFHESLRTCAKESKVQNKSSPILIYNYIIINERMFHLRDKVSSRPNIAGNKIWLFIRVSDPDPDWIQIQSVCLSHKFVLKMTNATGTKKPKGDN